jgi:hypothetical protein
MAHSTIYRCCAEPCKSPFIWIKPQYLKVGILVYKMGYILLGISIRYMLAQRDYAKNKMFDMKKKIFVFLF